MKIKNLTIGADPEVFLTKDNKIVSAEGIIGGTKEKPLDVKHGLFLLEDNVMVEFNIPPSSDKESFINNMRYARMYLDSYVAIKGYGIDYSAAAHFTKDEVSTEQAKRFGCDPDFNVYLKEINIPPSSKTTLRCCGGHIHVGYDDPQQDTSELLVKALDITLGLDSILLDKDTERRKMYGKAGTFRFKEYGIEYRTLSNYWIASDNLVGWVYSRVEKAIELVNSDAISSILNDYENAIVSTINNHDISEVISLSTVITNKINSLIIK